MRTENLNEKILLLQKNDVLYEIFFTFIKVDLDINAVV